MIIIPIFMPQPRLGFYTRSVEEKQQITARREAVLYVLKHNSELTLQEVSIKANQDIRTTQAILTALKKNGMVESEFTPTGKLWRLTNDRT